METYPINPLASTKKWKKGVKVYKENLQKYQPGPIQPDVFNYARGRESFYRWEGFEIASKLGYRKVILEDLS